MSAAGKADRRGIVPATRLLGWIALLALPAVTVGGVLREQLPLAAVVIAGLALIFFIDARRAPAVLARLSVVLPPVVRLYRHRAGIIEVQVHTTPPSPRMLRIGIAFPPEIEATAERDVILPPESPSAKFAWDCRPTARGNFFIDSVHVETASPWGFWAARATLPAAAELRVYPDLLRERKHVSALFLRRGGIGARVQRSSGQGREFEKLRDYVHKDSLGDIHWKASAKRGRPVTKVYQIERTQEVYVIVDASRLTGRTVELAAHVTADAHREASAETITTTALERFVAAALLLALAAQQQGDQFGLLTFSDKILGFVRAKSGQAHYDACRDRLYALQPEAVTPDFEELFAFIRRTLRRRALLIFLTALDDPLLAETFVQNIDLIARQHLVLVNMVEAREVRPLFSDEAIEEVDEIYEQLGGHLQWQQMRELQKVLQRRGVRLALLDPEKLPAELISQHAEMRARQLV
jgi:uncharacterized protein (DUF58 family)